METYKLYTDGSYQSDANIIGIGGYLMDSKNNCIFEFSEQVYDSSSYKYHESLALIYGLKKALEHGVKHIECFSDDVSARNVFNKEVLSDISSSVNPFRKDIFLLKKQFDMIFFHHLPRNLNKKADKLAGKILRIYNEDILPNRQRSDFIGQEDKFLNIPQLICDEDYEVSLDRDKTIEYELQSIHQYFFLDIFKNDITPDNIDDNNSLTINSYFIELDSSNLKEIKTIQLVSSHPLIQKKLTTRGLEILTDCFNEYSSLTKTPSSQIGLMFNAVEQPLQKVDMLLRKRGVLPLPHTPLTRAFLSSVNKFTKIVLHNDLRFIYQSKLLINKPIEDTIKIKIIK